ncbi:probable 2-oxoglutarate-dependent dioxygenase AOP1 [Mercurialis annua]|uniref:probable 2-oxoglutarate-dependent dioxygenase AOP1 n=1 Tax=Mercurialis annua TaxID=3986 RepID=UPI00215E53B0|nr:probable 2-oxoglutarate-dependent dioxygenase AOP1 [Mercurialis annua]
MGSDGDFSFPVIDFSDPDLKPGTTTWDLVKSQVHKAAEEYGCFQAFFNKIPQELQKGMNGALEEMFQLPEEIKKCNVSEKPFHGYLGSSSSIYESLAIDEPDIFNKVENFTNVLWPEGNTNFSNVVHSFSHAVVELDQTIRRMILEGLGVEKYADEHINSAKYLLRVSKYEAPRTTDKKIGLSAHTDTNFITILCQNQVNGLEIQTKNGDWIPVQYSADSFFVLVGEAFRAWVNNRVYSPYHRVMIAGDSKRYSGVMFSMPKENDIIKAIEELVDEEHPLVYKPFCYGEYLKQRLAYRYADRFAEGVLRNIIAPPLKEYFGV